jgi:hypothetical protein
VQKACITFILIKNGQMTYFNLSFGHSGAKFVFRYFNELKFDGSVFEYKLAVYVDMSLEALIGK